MFYEVVVVKAGGKVDTLTYNLPAELLPAGMVSLRAGQIVEVPLRREKVVGVVMKKVAQPDFPTKPIARIIYSTPLPWRLLKTAEFIAEYYATSLPSAMRLMLPVGVEKQRRGKKPNKTEQDSNQGRTSSECSLEPAVTGLDRSVFAPSANMLLRSPVPDCSAKSPIRSDDRTSSVNIPLNPAQKEALEGLQKDLGTTKLLFGVTGSGKTNVYLSGAVNALKRRKSVILLVPEIALTGQLVRVFEEVFGERVRVMHSGLTEAERHLLFEELLGAEEPCVVVGARSALFAPVKDLGLIIIDEEHEATYIQENAPRYSAIRVASFMAGVCKCYLMLGSATPTVVDYYLAEQKQAVVKLPQKAKRGAKKAEIKVIDFKNRDEFSRNKYFSNSLLMAIKRNLNAGQQTLIFHNRRGSAPLTLCENCGHEFACPECFLPLTLHADDYMLVCHTCGHREKVPFACPECGQAGVVHKGFGTKLLETELSRLFPKARVRRFDADNKKGEGLEATYAEVRDGGVDILVGTQTLAKGLDLPLLATVGVVQADAGLSLPDFAAEERTFQLLTQVIGRVGRGHLETAEVFIQTFRKDHPVIKYAVAEDYEGFYEYMCERRRKSGFPPFGFVTTVQSTAKTEATAMRKIQGLARKLGADARLKVSPAMPAFHERNSRGYTWQLVVRARSRKALVEVLAGLDTSFHVTFDPASLLG